MNDDQRRLLWHFSQGGCIRRPRRDRLGQGSGRYKKGWEVRLLVYTAEELAEVRTLLARCGLRAGEPYAKGQRTVQPVYGELAVACFDEWLRVTVGV